MNSDNPGRYDDIIDLPHHVSKRHKPMSMLNRAAQFAPYATLRGYGDAIDEAGRLTDRRVELSESDQAALNDRLTQLSARLPAEAEVTWFVPDARKAGGHYVTRRLAVRRILPEEGRIALSDGGSIDLDSVIDIE